MKLLARLLLVVVVLVLIAGLVFWRRPFWVDQQRTHLGLFLARVQSNYVLTPAGRVHYYEAEPRFAPAHGIPLVLIHGLADRDESWAPMLKQLKKAGFHVYAPDLLGYGRSPKSPTGDYSIAAQSQFVVDFIQALGLPKTNLGGWSMGGWVAMQTALDQPGLIDRLVVYNSVGLTMAPPPAQAFHPRGEADVQQLFALLEPGNRALPAFVVRDTLRRFAANQDVVDRSVAAMLTGRDVVDRRIASLPQPFLIVWGNKDALTPLSLGERLHELDPRSELDVVEGCGHLAPLLCTSRVAAATADFLKSTPAPSGSVRTLAAMH